jgi:hypothetical protein
LGRFDRVAADVRRRIRSSHVTIRFRLLTSAATFNMSKLYFYYSPRSTG